MLAKDLEDLLNLFLVHDFFLGELGEYVEDEVFDHIFISLFEYDLHDLHEHILVIVKILYSMTRNDAYRVGGIEEALNQPVPQFLTYRSIVHQVLQFLARLGDVGLNCNFGLEEMLQGFLFLLSEILTTQEKEASVSWELLKDLSLNFLSVLKSFYFENETINPSEVGVVSEFVKELPELT